MASTTVEFQAPSGLTLTMKIYSADTIQNGAGDACTERTNALGFYTATVTEALSGWYTVSVVDGGGNVIVTYRVELVDDTGTYHCVDATWSRSPTKGDLDDLNDITTAGVLSELGNGSWATEAGGTGDHLTGLPGVTLADGAITDASLAGNMEIVFETDFATNYNTTRNAWVTNAQDFVGTTAADPFNGQIVAASVTGAVGSVTGAVGSVTGNVGGNVVGSVASVTAGVTLANGAVTDASLAGNMEIVFETDFATNYNATRNAWATNVQDTVGTGTLGLNDVSTSDLATALTDIHLDHLLAADYDPASKPGTATALLNELVENDGGVSRFTTNALEQAPSGGGGGDATAANQTTIITHLTDIKGTGFAKDTDSMVDLAHIGADGDTLETLSDQLDLLGAGTGARTVTVTVNDGTNPLESARVRYTKGAESYAQTTDASGNCTFNLDDGTWTVAISLAGYTFSGTTLVVDGTETPTYSMTAVSITAPSDTSLCTVQFRVKHGNTAVSGAVCKAHLSGINEATDGVVLSNVESSDTTDANGVAELQLVRQDQITKGTGVYEIVVEIDNKPVANIETTIPNQATALFEDML